jgi:enolase
MNEILIVSDDLTVTQKDKIEVVIKEKCANALIIKPNQVGTITETIESVRTAKMAGFKIIASHRSGETNDDFIADLAVGIEADFIKAGAPVRGERVSKYNRLLKIEKEIMSK